VSNSLFARLVELSGLSPIFADATVRRTIERAGLSPERLVRQDIAVIIPELANTLSPFLGKDTETRIRAMRKLGNPSR
jgi:hypothetical protein